MDEKITESESAAGDNDALVAPDSQLAEPVEQPPATEPPGSWRPADYYARPVDPSRSLPRWVPLSCGVASLVFLVFLFLAGSLLLSGGLDKLMALTFGELQSESEKLYTPDVSPAERAAFKAALLSLRDRLAGHKVSLAEVLPVLQELQSATADGKLTPGEVERLTKAMVEIDAARKPPAAQVEPPTVDL